MRAPRGRQGWVGWGGEATGRGAAGQNSTKGSAQFSDEQSLQQPGWGKALGAGLGKPECTSLQPPKGPQRPTDQSPARLGLYMGKRRPPRATERGYGVGTEPEVRWSPGKSSSEGLCSDACSVFPCQLGLQLRPTQGPLMEAPNAQVASVGAWTALVLGQR